jgi:hypothetical protein
MIMVALVVASSAAVSHAQWTVAYYQPYTSYYAPATTAYYAPATTAYYAPATTAYYAPATTAYYAPATTAYYSPAATPVVQTSAWYPGYWWDRVRTRLFPARTVVAAYPTSYAASYPVTYAASYPTTYTASYATNYVASYPTSYVASYPAASTCCAPAQQVTLRPVCDPCASCAVSSVSQVGYVQQSSDCCTPTAPAMSPTPAGQSPSTYGQGTSQPMLNPSEAPPADRGVQRPTGENNSAAPTGTGTSSGSESTGDGTRPDPLDQYVPPESKGTLNEAPPLFAPASNDKTVRYSPAPVNLAVYKRPLGTTRDRVSTQPITFEKAQRDAVGWTSASK